MAYLSAQGVCRVSGFFDGRYEVFVGMEVHAELVTRSKMFCGCPNAFGGDPNTRCCPVCLGLPGALPRPNREAIELVLRAALALNCRIPARVRFDRKNYFYPDLPKGYQITQYDEPIGSNGWIDIRVPTGLRRIRIRRVHLEEDTGKLMHLADGTSAVDYNRAGVPLMEIVTEFPPDIRSAEEAAAYAAELRSILTFIGVSDGRMEEGSLRCEPNVSIRAAGRSEYGTKTEIKNLNSFRAVHKGIEYEVRRHAARLDAGHTVIQETLGWDADREVTVPQRTKEIEQEYRYFPDPDIRPIALDAAWLHRIRQSMPETPSDAYHRLTQSHGLRPQAAEWLTASPDCVRYFTEVHNLGAASQEVAAWMMGDYARLMNAAGLAWSQPRVPAKHLAALLDLVQHGTISSKMAKAFFEEMFETGASPQDLLQAQGSQLTEADEIRSVIDAAVAAHPDVWQAYTEGDERKLTYLMGQIMKATGGKANPKVTRQLLIERQRETAK